MRNCLRSRLVHAAIGRDCYLLATRAPGAVVELRRLSNGGWVAMEIWGPRNRRPDPGLEAEIRRKLDAAGVVSLGAPQEAGDLSSLALFFNAYDLTDAWIERDDLGRRLIREGVAG